MGALGLMRDTTKSGAQRSLSLLRPESEDGIKHLAKEMAAWLGMDEEQTTLFEEKLGKAGVHKGFSKKTFDFVMETVQQSADGAKDKALKAASDGIADQVG